MEENITDIALKFTDTKTKITKEIIIKECLVTINQEKNIVATPIDGRVGTIKEYISDGDFQITLDVGISNDIDFYDVDNNTKHQEYPADKIKAFIDLLKVGESLIVDNWFLKQFKVYNITIQSYSLQQETHSNRQFISVKCLSDDAYEIKAVREKNV